MASRERQPPESARLNYIRTGAGYETGKVAKNCRGPLRTGHRVRNISRTPFLTRRASFMRTIAMAICLSLVPNMTGQDARLLRFPTIHDKTVVFGYAGNLYSVPATGGIARRLTSHDGYEMFPRFSPSGE